MPTLVLVEGQSSWMMSDVVQVPARYWNVLAGQSCPCHITAFIQLMLVCVVKVQAIFTEEKQPSYQLLFIFGSFPCRSITKNLTLTDLVDLVTVDELGQKCSFCKAIKAITIVSQAISSTQAMHASAT